MALNAEFERDYILQLAKKRTKMEYLRKIPSDRSQAYKLFVLCFFVVVRLVTERITNSGVEKSCMFSAESSRIVFRSWSLFLVHTGLLDHTDKI